MIINKGWKYSY